jgi:hypothetical protein
MPSSKNHDIYRSKKHRAIHTEVICTVGQNELWFSYHNRFGEILRMIALTCTALLYGNRRSE